MGDRSGLGSGSRVVYDRDAEHRLTDAFGTVLTLRKDVTISGIIAGEYVPGPRGLIERLPQTLTWDQDLNKASSEHRFIGFTYLVWQRGLAWGLGFRAKEHIRHMLLSLARSNLV